MKKPVHPKSFNSQNSVPNNIQLQVINAVVTDQNEVAASLTHSFLQMKCLHLPLIHILI